MKVHELAKEIGVASKHVSDVCHDMGIEIKGAQSNLPDEQLDILRQTLNLMLELGQIKREKRRPSVKRKRPAKKPEAAGVEPAAAEAVAAPAAAVAAGEAATVSAGQPAETTAAVQEAPAAEAVKTAAIAAAKPEKAKRKKEKKRKPGVKIEFQRVGTVEAPKADGLFEVVGKVQIDEPEPAPPPPEVAEDEREARVRALLARLGRNWEDLPGMQKVRSGRGRAPRTRQTTRTRRRKRLAHRLVRADQSPHRGKTVAIEPPLTVRTLAETLGVQATILLGRLSKEGHTLSLDDQVADDTAQLLALEFEVELDIRRRKQALEVVQDAFARGAEQPAAVPRPPVVTVMGHVDHGKTSLLDRIRNTQVAKTEFGGITQNIRAYQVQVKDQHITFVDTPGHEAFTEMRLRGARVTDIVVLVVAADDGVMPQTVEAIEHTRAAGVPMVVAANKMDLPAASLDKVKQGLARHNVITEDWGGDVMVVPCSAETGQGIAELLDAVLLQAEMLGLSADPAQPADGFVIEARREQAQGPVIDVIVKRGTLRIGDVVVAGTAAGRVRSMLDWKGAAVAEAPPSRPVRVFGFEDVPAAGDRFVVLADLDTARRAAAEHAEAIAQTPAPQAATLEAIAERLKSIGTGAKAVALNLVVKTDVQGSIDAIRREIGRIGELTDEVDIKVIHAGVGAVNTSDVLLASATGAVVIGFNVGLESRANRTASEKNVQTRIYRLIYDLSTDLKQAVEGMLAPEEREAVSGHAEVRQVFDLSRAGRVAGCFVSDGKVESTSRARLLRGGRIIYDGKVAGLRRFKEDVREVREGFECGIRLDAAEDIAAGDVIEAYTIERVRRSL